MATATKAARPRRTSKVAMSVLIKALEDAWATSIARKYPELPKEVVITVSSGGKRSQTLLAHFWARRWVTGTAKGPSKAKNPSLYHEVVVVAEGLNRPAEDVFGSLLHEAVHARAHAMEVRDTSKDGRYHNRRFAEMAESMGLAVTMNASLGYAFTSILPDTSKQYRTAIAKIAAAQKMFRQHDGKTIAKPKDRNYAKAECECSPPRVIRVSKATLEEGGLGCAFCDGEFHAAS